MNTKKILFHSFNTGLTLAELLITICILGILTSIILVNLSSTWSRSKLLATTRALENWLNTQRNYAMIHSLTCIITIDPKNKRLISTIDSGNNSTPCNDQNSNPNDGVFSLSTLENDMGKQISLTVDRTDGSEEDLRFIRFQHQGFSQHLKLSSDGILMDNDRKDGIIEIRLAHENLQQQRCIRIISPIGMMRDGYKEESTQRCNYDESF
jgi:Tfp pilus assembly protein FimT|tara:strand:+ start:2308 stop:2937 length:630 start_codon:yes stop_codon:yes gene_type:complete